MKTGLSFLVVCVVCVSASNELWMKLWSAQVENALEMDMLSETDGNIPQVAEQLGETVLVKLVKTAGLAEALSGTGPLTVFGPTNAAFKAIPKPFINVLLKNVTLLKDILLYHVASGNVLSTDLKDNLLIDSLQGKQIRINIYKKGTVITASGRQVTLPDQKASNGVIHEVGRVLLPPPGTVTFAVSKCPIFSTLLKAVSAAGLADTLDGAGPFTVFAPTNKAFAKIPKKCLNYLLSNKKLLTEVLTYHVVSGVAYSAGLTCGEEVPTLNGKSVKITLPGAGKVRVNGVPVSYADGSVTNGVIHVIDSVLLPCDDMCDGVKEIESEVSDDLPAWFKDVL